jgi:hypothetical protein
MESPVDGDPVETSPANVSNAQMCGRFTYKLTWAEIVALYRLSTEEHARNSQPRYNVCPTTTIDVVGVTLTAHLIQKRMWIKRQVGRG